MSIFDRSKRTTNSKFMKPPLKTKSNINNMPEILTILISNNLRANKRCNRSKLNKALTQQKQKVFFLIKDERVLWRHRRKY